MILITGAAGQTGRAVIDEFVRRGTPVRALCARPAGPAGSPTWPASRSSRATFSGPVPSAGRCIMWSGR
jgi:nucleoside-diphosphate-sugar epimerase